MKKKKYSTAIRHYLEYIIFRGTLGFLRLFPYKFSKTLLIIIFDLIGFRLGLRRKLAEKQLYNVFPEKGKKEIKHIIKRVYRYMALNAAETFLISDEELFNLSRFENVEYAHEAQALGKGVLLITGHFGNWESPLRVLPMAGMGVAAITKRQHNHLFNKYLNSIRERQNGSVIDMKVALKGVLEHTKHNDYIGILIDQDAGKRGILTDFLGKPASCWQGTAKIALKYKIPIVPGFVIRDMEDKLVFRFEKMLPTLDLTDTSENVLKVVNMMNKVLEDKVRQYPEQWFWLHNRWKGAKHFLQ